MSAGGCTPVSVRLVGIVGLATFRVAQTYTSVTISGNLIVVHGKNNEDGLIVGNNVAQGLMKIKINLSG
jgi:hypothetical protein